MRIFKVVAKIVGVLSLSYCITSCFDSSYTESYPLNASFEYGNALVLRADSTYFAETSYAIAYNYLAFCHEVDEQTRDFLGGFRISALQGQVRPVTEDNTDADAGDDVAPQATQQALPLGNEWRVHAAPLANTYMVYYMSSHRPDCDIQFLLPTNGTCLLKSCVVANTAKVAEEIAKNFERGDRLVLRATGYKKDKVTGTAEIALADYTLFDKGGQPKDSIVSTWTTFDLSELELVDEVKFEMSSEKSIQKYFCLDNLTADITIEY